MAPTDSTPPEPDPASDPTLLPSPDWLARLRTNILARGPAAAYAGFIAENEQRIRTASLDAGASLVVERSAIHTELVRHWAETRHRRSGYDKPFAVVALGGTGRAEVTPASDLDFAFLFDDALEGNAFLLDLQQQLLHSDAFEREYGFHFDPLPFNLDDAPRLAGKQLNSFIDLRAVHDPEGLAERFRERIRATYDSFEHFLHVRAFWRDQWEKASREVERLDEFDIKNDALRVFLAGIWTLAGKRFITSREVYRDLADPRDLAAYHFLLRIRCFTHLRQAGRSRRASAGGNHPEDILRFEDFSALDQLLPNEADPWSRFEFGNQVRARLLSARRRVARFTRAIIEGELRGGRPIAPDSPISCGVGGLYRNTPVDPAPPEARSRAALGLLLASQRYEVPIDSAELECAFRDAGDWLQPVPELGALFYEPRGSLSRSFEFLAQIDGAEERLFPGYARYEASLDSRVMTEGKSLRGALEREKMRAFERMLSDGRQRLEQAVSPQRLADVTHAVDPAIAAALLDADHTAAIKLGLKTKRLPLTPEDLRLRHNPDLELHERFSSGLSDIPIDRYYAAYRGRAGFSDETLRIAQALVTHRRAFKDRAETPNDARQVAEFAQLCGDETFLRALYVFTAADRAHWESVETHPTRWFNSRELFFKTVMSFRPAADPAAGIQRLGVSREEASILRDLGIDFWTGEYRQYASTFTTAIRALVDPNDPAQVKAMVLSGGPSPILGVAARDFRGLAACITGALWQLGVQIRQAHLFSAMNHGLALDFFHLAPPQGLRNRDLLAAIEDAVRHRRHIDSADESRLPSVQGSTSIHEWRPGQYCLRHETTRDEPGRVYALAYRVFRHLQGNIFGLVAHAARGTAYISIYLSLPPHLTLPAAESIVRQTFH